MNCVRVQELLSAYHDDELAPAVREQVRKHLQSCAECAEELGHFERLSKMAAELEEPVVPSELWPEIETRLARRHGRPAATTRSSRRTFFGAAALTAALIVIGIGFGLWSRRTGVDQRAGHAGVDLAPYARQFVLDPMAAQRSFLKQYAYRSVTMDEAEQALRYRPAVADELLDGFVLGELRLVDMPCCCCVQVIYRKSDGQTLATFQQSSSEPLAFRGLAGITCICNGKETDLVEIDGRLAASWPAGNGFLTLVGARNLEQVVQAMTELDE